MSLQNIPNMSTRIEEYAAWLITEAGTRKEMKKRLGNELVHLCTEIDEEEEKVFLIECEKCELPLIVHHNLDGSSCAFMNFFEAATETAIDTILHSVTNLNGALLATQQGKENFSAAFMEEIEKLPEYEQVKPLLEELKIWTCVCKKVCANERGLKVHKRKCDVAKNALTREPSTASSTSENSMIIQLMNQMKEDRRI